VIIALVPFGVVQRIEGGGARKKPKKRGGIRVNPHSSLAVFYVEQVALNRHVLFQFERENRVGRNRVNNFVENSCNPLDRSLSCSIPSRAMNLRHHAVL
jgi:hypothetical protein